MISDFRVLTGQKELFGLVASVPARWRTLDEIAAGGPRALARITKAVNSARRQAWAAGEARHSALPGVPIADKGPAEGDLHPAGRHRHPGTFTCTWHTFLSHQSAC